MNRNSLSKIKMTKSLLIISTMIGFTLTGGSQGLAADKPAMTPADYKAAIDKVRYAKKVDGVNHTAAIPSNFPIATYPKNVVFTDFVNPTSGPPMAMATIVTKDPPKTVFEWYQMQCSTGWKVSTPPSNMQTEREQKGLMYRMNALKDKQQITISCIKQQKSGNTRVSIVWVLQKN